MTAPVPSLTAFLRPELPEAALLGLAGEVTRTLADVSDADPTAILLSYLTLLGNAIGPEPHLDVGPVAHGARLFTVIVGDPGQGRKGTSLALASALFADTTWRARWERGLQSAEALVSRVSGVQDPRLMLIETEFARLVQRMRGGPLSEVLRAAYDGGVMKVTRADPRKNLISHRNHVSLIAHITPAELARYQGYLQSAGGLERRMLFALVNRTKEISPFAAAKIPASLAERTADAIRRAQTLALETADPISRELCLMRAVMPLTEFGLSAEVRENWSEVIAGLPPGGEGLTDLFATADVHIARLAFCYALADSSPVVAMRHVEAADALWRTCARSAEMIFGAPAGLTAPDVDPRQVRKVLEALRKVYPGALTRTDISHKVLSGNHGGSDPIVAWLLDRRLVQLITVPSGGRPAEGIRLVLPPGSVVQS